MSITTGAHGIQSRIINIFFNAEKIFTVLQFALFAHVLISLSTIAKFIKVYFCTFVNKIIVFANNIFTEYSSVIIFFVSLESFAILEA